MNNQEFREKRRSTYRQMRMMKDLTMSIIILAMSFVMFFGKKIQALKPIMEHKDPLLVNIFGGLCLVYGSFRLYRSIKRDY